MSRGSTASGRTPTQLPSRSAWAKGPPQNRNSSAPSPRSSPPTPSRVHSISASHSRRPSTLGQGVSIKEGISIPRRNVCSARQGSSLNFALIDDAFAPVSSSPTATPVVRNKSVKSFGSLPATALTPTISLINGNPGSSAVPYRHSPQPMSTATSTSSAATPPTTSSTSTPSSSTSASTSSSATSSTSTSSTTTAKSFNVAKLFHRTIAHQILGLPRYLANF